MKEYPPKMPGLFDYAYNLQNNNSYNKINESFGEIYNETVPIIFNNHLMTIINEEKANKKNTYIKSSITQRNKKKLLTILYYSPKP